MNTKVKSTIFLFITAIVWGFAFVAQKLGGDTVQPFYFNGIRFVLGSVALIPVVLIFERGKADRQKLIRTVKAAAICALFQFVASALQQRGVVMTDDAGKSGFITALYSVLVPVFYFVLFRKKTAVNVWIGALFAVAGVFFLSITDSFTIGYGDLVLLAGSVFWAGHIMSIDRFVKEVYLIRFAMFQAFFCGIYNLVLALPTETLSVSGISSALVPILYCGICSVGIAYTCQIIGQKDADPTAATIILSTESLFSVIGGAIIDGETMALRGYFGCALIFAGVIISQLVFEKNKKIKE